MNSKNLYLHLRKIIFLVIPLHINAQQESKRESIDPIKDLLPIIQPFTMSGSIEKIVEFLKNFEPSASYTVAEHIIMDKESPLNKEDKEQLIVELAQAFNKNVDVQKKLFDLLFVLLGNVEPLQLVHVAEYGYGPLIPSFIKWAQERKAQHPELKDIATQSLFRAIDNNDVKALKTLLTHGIVINKRQASELLWHAVSHGKNSKFISLLAEHHADLWSTNKGHTLVTKAVELNNKNLVAALIASLKKERISQKKISEYLNRFADKTVGSPLQIALAKKYTDLEIYLREQGAGE